MLMATTNEITAYKAQLISSIVQNEKIVKAIDSHAESYISGQGDTLINTNIFPMLRIPDITEDASTYIGVEVDILQINTKNPSFHKWSVTIWVMAHRDHIFMKETGYSRLDYISDELRLMLQDSLDYGFGVLNLVSNTTNFLNEKFTYRQLKFVTDDFKKPVYG